MLAVITIQEAEARMREAFGALRTGVESLARGEACGRTLAEAVRAPEDVPGFLRSSVDGYAVHAADTFGSSESLPALLRLAGEVRMGEAAGFALAPGECAYVPTGGALPTGADAMIMLEYAERFGAEIGILRPAAPGHHCIYRGDDVRVGAIVLPAGRLLRPHDIGALAAMGISNIRAAKKPRVGILSTGDELTASTPREGQVRDVNGPLLAAAAQEAGGEAIAYGVCPDDPTRLEAMLRQMAAACDIVLLSGGTSVGEKDAAPRVLAKAGRVFFHGLALKPGKPTLAGEIAGKPIIALPGHPVAAYVVFLLLIRPLIGQLLGQEARPAPRCTAALESAIPANHGREECIAIALEGGLARPIMGKSGLISLLSGTAGYLRIPRDTEGLAAGEAVEITLF